MRKWHVILTFLLLFAGARAMACTSVIISARKSGLGKPVMLKHRDTDDLDNRIERFKGRRYDFIGLVNSKSPGGEVWAGTNTVGFCIMNTATYDLKDDNLPQAIMDQEGRVMYKALSLCRTLADFEHLLDTLRRPMGVEANFGVIDAQGGAAYYEVNNFRWVKFDVNKDEKGYQVVTNFTRTGRKEDRRGFDRYIAANYIMDDLAKYGEKMDHREIINSISRSGDPILRSITSASIVFEGVKPGENPLHTVMWTVLGYPTTSVCIPLLVMDSDIIPYYMKKSGISNNSRLCDYSLKLKNRNADVAEQCREMERSIDLEFNRIFENWEKGYMTTDRFKDAYGDMVSNIFFEYKDNFMNYLK